MCEELCCFQSFSQALFDVPMTFDDFVVLAYLIVPYTEVIACLVLLSETGKFSIF